VWLQYGVHSAPAFRYAMLDRRGQVGRVVTIGHLGSPLETVQFAVNGQGAVAASWVNTGKPFGNRPRVSAELCDPLARCAPRRTISFKRPIGQNDEVSTTFSDGRTATVLISGYANGFHYGLQAAISRGGGPFLSTPMISPTGANQVASAAGARGAVAAFNVGGIPVKTLAWSRLRANGALFTKPQTSTARKYPDQ